VAAADAAAVAAGTRTAAHDAEYRTQLQRLIEMAEEKAR
jgi:hypothetical protein